MLSKITYIIIPALLFAGACLDRSVWRRVVRVFGPLYKVSESPEPSTRPVQVAVPRYEPCLAGCCDEDPEFCALIPGLTAPSGDAQLSDACGYASVRDRCVKSCNRCFEPEGSCEDVWPSCSQTLETSPEFCELDASVQFCKRTCKHCTRPDCADSLDKSTVCERAKKDLRDCAKESVREGCPQTCGVCAKQSLAEVLRYQPCVDESGCELSDDDVVDATMAKFHNCEDIGYCEPRAPKHLTKEDMCADPMFRDTLCRGTCVGYAGSTCTPTVVPPSTFLAPPRKAQVGPETCPVWKALKCPKKCGVCKAAGSRSIWEVSDVDRLVATAESMRRGLKR